MSDDGGGDAALVLVVDDEPKNLQVVGAVLRGAGLRVAFATDGARAIEMVRDAPPDLVLLDVGLPGLDGFETCRRLKADRFAASIPVLFLTARARPEDVLAGFDAGGADYVTKPFHPAELLARVRVHAQLRRLRGLLTVCCHCQRIRNERASWEPLDRYVSRHAGAPVSHGLCDACLAEHYP